MAIGTLFTLLILPAVYLVFAAEHKSGALESGAKTAPDVAEEVTA